MKSFMRFLRKDQPATVPLDPEIHGEPGDAPAAHLSLSPVDSRPRLPTPTSSDDDSDSDEYDKPEFIHEQHLSTEGSRARQLPRLPTRGDGSAPKIPLLPPNKPKQSKIHESQQLRNNQSPTVSLNSPPIKKKIPIPIKPMPSIPKTTNVNVVKPTFTSRPKLESRLQGEIAYVHTQRLSGFNLFEISLQGTNNKLTKPPIPQKPGKRILIKKPPPPPSKVLNKGHINNKSVEHVKTLSVYELAEELSKLNVERCVAENVKRLNIDGALVTSMSQSLIAKSLQANELDTLKIYQFIYNGWKPKITSPRC
ncbi:uncharacterized protein LOC117121781 [Anneissia japonica]|uniref:uncharacterized protein LOC117121781 n=1 Tax=Anneissia japonica TaxID=1529436 RepID=UPI0014258851|nr:uncharacterized protein LOC117121781 [Anneissia japonica]